MLPPGLNLPERTVGKKRKETEPPSLQEAVEAARARAKATRAEWEGAEAVLVAHLASKETMGG